MGVRLKNGQKVGRNQQCLCGSGLKAKYCHLDPMKVAVCNRVANEKMVQLIMQDKKKRGLIPMKYKCNTCGQSFDEPDTSIITGQAKCPKCSSVDIEKVK